ncbi:hypothetical protein [Bradyrhizobium commune]|uniref:DUF4149 domain-containing protein n=1 Tax=Bradyrhizobium commune TaxID=83627 RepID=A0A7S9D9F5_9BRAD|nr:hypothetical protein [Bradyrhizobium commune]QPF93651.1 hypothetical protein IC761_10450 [Bradyrhizobium commune]
MRPDAVAVAALVILLFPMGYFLLASPAFLLVKLDIPPVTQLLRGMFNIQFRMIGATGVLATVAFLVAGRPLFAIGIGLIASLAIWGRGWFMKRMDDQLSARDAGDADAVRRLRRLHWSGMLCNAALVAALVASIPYVAMST